MGARLSHAEMVRRICQKWAPSGQGGGVTQTIFDDIWQRSRCAVGVSWGGRGGQLSVRSMSSDDDTQIANVSVFIPNFLHPQSRGICSKADELSVTRGLQKVPGFTFEAS